MRIVPLPVTYNDAELICSQLGDGIPFADNMDEFQILSHTGSRDHLDRNCFGSAWTPLQWSSVNSTKWEVSHQTVHFLPWAPGEPQREYLDRNCVMTKRLNDKYFIYSSDCHSILCPPCQFFREPIFKMRGLCPGQNLVDTDYHFLVNENNEVLFQGLLGRTYISLNKSNFSWNLRSVKKFEGFEAHFGSTNNIKLFPLGLYKWNLKMNCEKITQTSSEFDLKLNKVQFNEIFWNFETLFVWFKTEDRMVEI